MHCGWRYGRFYSSGGPFFSSSLLGRRWLSMGEGERGGVRESRMDRMYFRHRMLVYSNILLNLQATALLSGYLREVCLVSRELNNE